MDITKLIQQIAKMEMVQKEIIALIDCDYDLDATALCWWDTGNFDDTYDMGREAGKAEVLYEISELLGMKLHAPRRIEGH